MLHDSDVFDGFSDTKTLVNHIFTNGDKKLAHSILDHMLEHYKNAKDLDLIGQLAVKIDHRSAYLKAAESGLAQVMSPAELKAARTNVLKAYNVMNYPEKALFYLKIQLEKDPENYDLLCQKAANLALSNKKVEAEQILEEIIKHHPDKEKDLNPLLSGKYFREGNLQKGIEAFIEAYKPAHKLLQKKFRMKRWRGEIVPGSTVYVDGEGGIGDEIINIRFFKEMEKLGIKPILLSADNIFYKSINDVFKRHGIEILYNDYTINKREKWVPMMSLPLALKCEEKDLWKGPYLFPIKNPKNKIESKKFKIGIKCSGNPYFGQDEYRKIPLDLMVNYLPEEAELYYIDMLSVDHPRVINLNSRIHSWEDTLDFIDQMDCIVSSCTSLVHAAGAMGKTTFVAVPISEYYVYTNSRQDSTCFWYGDNFYVARQTQVRDWNKPLQEITTQLKKLIKD